MRSFESIICGVMLCLFSLPAAAAVDAYLPLSKVEMRNRFPVKYVGTIGSNSALDIEGLRSKELEKTLRIGSGDAQIIDTSDLTIVGKDKLGKPWRIELGDFATNYSCRFYRGDIDHNGLSDAVLVFPTGGVGLAPQSHLIAVTFEEDGRPVTWQVDGYFEETNNGIADLVDLNRDGRADLVYMSFDEGYWITNVYSVKDGRWQRVNGHFAGRSFPLYTRFTNRPNRRSVRPKPGRNPFGPDLSNTTPYLTGHLKSFKWANVQQSEDIDIELLDARGRQTSHHPISWYSTFAVILDSAAGRHILSLSADASNLRKALGQIKDEGYRTELFGRRKRDSASPELLWAVR